MRTYWNIIHSAASVYQNWNSCEKQHHKQNQTFNLKQKRLNPKKRKQFGSFRFSSPDQTLASHCVSCFAWNGAYAKLHHHHASELVGGWTNPFENQHLPKGIKGCCLNPKGWWFSAPQTSSMKRTPWKIQEILVTLDHFPKVWGEYQK